MITADGSNETVTVRPEGKRRRIAPLVLPGAVVGIVTAGVALALGELVAYATGPASAPVDAVGAAVVDLTPGPVKEFAIRNFGSNDKHVLIGGVLVVIALVAMAAGVVALRRLRPAAAVVALFGVVGAIAGVTRGGASWTYALPPLLGAAVAVAVMRGLVHLYRREWLSADGMPLPRVRGSRSSGRPAGRPAPRTSGTTGRPRRPVPRREASGEVRATSQGKAQGARPARVVPRTGAASGQGARPGYRPRPGRAPQGSRRAFIGASAGAAVGAAVVGFSGEALVAGKFQVAQARAKVRIPAPTTRAALAPRRAHPDVPDLSPFYTPNSAFYRIDTALVVPQVDPDTWRLRIRGMVDTPIELTFDDLLRMPLEEHDMTLSCVSNPVGGTLVGNARWIGAPLAPILRRAGVKPGATQLFQTSTDGLTIGVPVESVLDGRASLLAVAMNGEPLPVKHGFPCRVLVPGFYGYSSACKWVTDLNVTTYQDDAAYWVQEGYARIGAMKIASRIDVPASGAHVAAGPVTVAGIAWITHVGISGAQVRVDSGPWQDAVVAVQDTPDTWRQWTFDWHATRGAHTLQVRAIDGTGTVQTGTQQQAFPAGATGYHTVNVTVS